MISAANFHPRPTTASFFPEPQKHRSNRLVVPLRSAAQQQVPTNAEVQRLVNFLSEDLPHLFDGRGIDTTAYDDGVKFRDPITKHDGISGYLFNIAMVGKLFNPDFQLHSVKQTGPYEISTRWTVVMKVVLLPWKPELVLTGTSAMAINPQNMKFCTHVDSWDSIKNNDYFSIEGFMDMVKQLRVYKTPDVEIPRYGILKRTANYEVRKYDPFIVVGTFGDKLSGSTDFSSVVGYAFFTRSFAPISVDDLILSSLQALNEAEVSLRKADGGIAAVLKFSGKPDEEIFQAKEKALRRNLARDGLRGKEGCLLARYNDPRRTWSFVMRNEVLIWLEEFLLN
ncbi:hypothetical protein AAHA92_16275 [Salvia divinorum]